MAKKLLKVDLTPEIKKLEIIPKKIVTTRLVGEYRSVFKGRGLEFMDYRPYSADDDASLIDWKASARAGELLVKEYAEERNLDVFLLIDASSNMVFGSIDKLKNEYAAELAASLAYIILQGGDKVGFALFTDKVIKRASPARGKNQFYILTKTLVDSRLYGGKFDLVSALQFLTNFLRKGSLVIIISDFLSLKGKWLENLKTSSNKLDIICLIVRDPRDRTMPQESYQVVLSDPNTGEAMIVNPVAIKEKYEKFVQQQTILLKNNLESIEVDFVELVTDKPFVQPIITLFRKRKARWR